MSSRNPSEVQFNRGTGRFSYVGEGTFLPSREVNPLEAADALLASQEIDPLAVYRGILERLVDRTAASDGARRAL